MMINADGYTLDMDQEWIVRIKWLSLDSVALIIMVKLDNVRTMIIYTTNLSAKLFETGFATYPFS